MKKAIPVLIVLSALILILIEPSVCVSGATEGILLSGRVIIPSLFPFTVCVLFIMKNNIVKAFRFLRPITLKLFGLSAEEFIIMILSFLGGYPVGAKLLSEAVKTNKISLLNAKIMLNYCVNAGPAFIVIAVGNGILRSSEIGYILLVSHILSSLVISLFFRKSTEKSIILPHKGFSLGITDNFVSSVTEAASAVFSVSAYVILFSALTAYINHYSKSVSILKFLLPFLEITNAVSNTKNILLISFALGFAGVSVWCQVMSVSKNIKFNFLQFFISRLGHGLLSSLITFLLLKIFKISVSVSSGVSFKATYDDISLSLALLVTVIIFATSLFNKKTTGNILEDIV